MLRSHAQKYFWKTEPHDQDWFPSLPVVSYMVLGLQSNFPESQCLFVLEWKYHLIATGTSWEGKWVSLRGTCRWDRPKQCDYDWVFCVCVQKVDLGRSQDGEGGILLGKWIWELKQLQTVWIPQWDREQGCWERVWGTGGERKLIEHSLKRVSRQDGPFTPSPL